MPSGYLLLGCIIVRAGEAYGMLLKDFVQNNFNFFNSGTYFKKGILCLGDKLTLICRVKIYYVLTSLDSTKVLTKNLN